MSYEAASTTAIVRRSPLLRNSATPSRTAKKAAAAPKKAAAAPKAAPKAETPKAEAPKQAEEHVKGMPKGYEEMTVAQVSAAAKTWNRPLLEAALEYERGHAARKGAIAALESALKAKEA